MQMSDKGPGERNADPEIIFHFVHVGVEGYGRLSSEEPDDQETQRLGILRHRWGWGVGMETNATVQKDLGHCSQGCLQTSCLFFFLGGGGCFGDRVSLLSTGCPGTQ